MAEALSDLSRCPECGAGNPAGAAWCGQCLHRFDAPREQGSTATARPVRALHAGRPAVATLDGALVWTCPACEATNAIEASACARCASSFTAFFGGAKAPPKPRASGRVAVGSSAVLPGLGHWAFGLTGQALARGVLYVWTLGIGVLLLIRPPASGRAVVRGIGAIFVLSAAAVWVVSLLETMRLSEGDRQPLIPPKALTWFAAGLSVVLLFGLLGAALAGRA